MSATRPPRRVNGSTRAFVGKIPMDVIGRMLARHYGFARRDIAPATAQNMAVRASGSGVGGYTHRGIARRPLVEGGEMTDGI